MVEGLLLGKSLAGHKGDKYIILEIMKTIFRDLALLRLDVPPEDLLNQDLWKSLDLETKSCLKRNILFVFMFVIHVGMMYQNGVD